MTQPDPDPLEGGLKHTPFASLKRPGVGDSREPRKPAPGDDAREEAAAVHRRITVRLERTGRGGKTVTIAEGPGLAGRALAPLAREIARALGSGARVEGPLLVVQGDQRDRLAAWLAAHGFASVARGN